MTMYSEVDMVIQCLMVMVALRQYAIQIWVDKSLNIFYYCISCALKLWNGILVKVQFPFWCAELLKCHFSFNLVSARLS